MSGWRGVRRRLVFILTNVLSIACLWWVLHDQKWAEFWEDLRTLHWGWVILAVVSDIAVYVVHGWRWSLLLKPIEEIPMWRSVRAIYVGLFANEILPSGRANSSAAISRPSGAVCRSR